MLKKFKDIFVKYGFQLEEDIFEKFISFSKILLEENEKYNLTRIVSESDFIEKHFVDSCMLSQFINKGTLLDVGSGAGFPGLVLAILLKDINVTLVESIGKKANFLKLVIKSLNLHNVEVINDRVENLKRRNHYDYATARAVAMLPIIAEYCVPFLKNGGKLLSQKGPRYIEEIEKGNLSFVGMKLNAVKEYDLSNGKRYILEVEKISDRIKIPRTNLKKIYS